MAVGWGHPGSKGQWYLMLFFRSAVLANFQKIAIEFNFDRGRANFAETPRNSSGNLPDSQDSTRIRKFYFFNLGGNKGTQELSLNRPQLTSPQILSQNPTLKKTCKTLLPKVLTIQVSNFYARYIVINHHITRHPVVVLPNLVDTLWVEFLTLKNILD
jgi:hypothetical protein